MVHYAKSFAKKRMASLLGDELLIPFFLRSRPRQLSRQDAVYLKLARRYGALIGNGAKTQDGHGKSDCVWSLWLQGEDKAPELVKTCWNSMRLFVPGHELVLLDSKNLFDHVDIPGYIVDKWRQGRFSATHFSDIIRTELMCSHGGLWLDSTVLLTGELSVPVLESPLFVYKQLCLENSLDCPIVASSWFISSDGRQRILSLTRDLLREYWKEHSYCIDYFLFHYFFAMSTRRYSDDWDRVPLRNNHTPHELLFELGSAYSESRWQDLLKSSAVHKLSYKVPYKPQDGTIYSYIIGEYADELNRRLR